MSWFLACVLCSLVCVLLSFECLQQVSLKHFMTLSGAHVNNEFQKKNRKKQRGKKTATPSRKQSLLGLPFSLLCLNHCRFHISQEPEPKPLTSELSVTRRRTRLYREQGAPVASHRGERRNKQRIRNAKLATEGEVTWGGAHTMQHTDDVLQNCTPETHAVSLIIVTLIKFREKKKERPT